MLKPATTPNKKRLILYLPEGSVLTLQAIASLTGDNPADILRRIIAEGLYEESSKVFKNLNMLNYGVKQGLFPRQIEQALEAFNQQRLGATDLELGEEEESAV